jgi:hypothetical protein
MDDILVPLILFIIVLIPQLLKQKQEKPIPKAPKKKVMLKNEEFATPAVLETHPVKSGEKTSVSVSEEQAEEQSLDSNTLINGVIFSEILQPPRAYRPYRRVK